MRKSLRKIVLFGTILLCVAACVNDGIEMPGATPMEIQRISHVSGALDPLRSRTDSAITSLERLRVNANVGYAIGRCGNPTPVERSRVAHVQFGLKG